MKKSLFMWLAIGSFGFVGALARYGIGRLFGRYSALFPFGTFFINITGSFFLGWFMTWAQPRLNIPDPIRLGIAVGFVGAYTTFSTYMFESDRMLGAGEALRGMVYVLGSVMLGILAVRLGVILGHRMS
ncbi:MAG: fluoride efflux transporter CrcB [Phycisphaerae bacterium]